MLFLLAASWRLVCVNVGIVKSNLFVFGCFVCCVMLVIKTQIPHLLKAPVLGVKGIANAWYVADAAIQARLQEQHSKNPERVSFGHFPAVVGDSASVRKASVVAPWPKKFPRKRRSDLNTRKGPVSPAPTLAKRRRMEKIIPSVDLAALAARDSRPANAPAVNFGEEHVGDARRALWKPAPERFAAGRTLDRLLCIMQKT